MPLPNPTLFLITGVSSGFGRALAEGALAGGHRVVGTVRSPEQAQAFEALAPGRALARVFDVTDTGGAAALVAGIEESVGAVGVLVNNAGYGHEGTLEESTLEDWRRQFEVNVFGAVALMQAVLPFMRARRAGHIINITSMGGMITLPGLSLYHGSKFALEGISESLAKEVRGLGIAVTAVAPGAFRTEWAGRSMARVPRRIADYDEVFDPIRQRRQEGSGRQPGDPAKAARAMLDLVFMENPPMHLLLGRDAVTLVGQKLQQLTAELKAHEPLSQSTDYE